MVGALQPSTFIHRQRLFFATMPAPPLRDHKLELDHLQRLARAFDAIGDEIGGARYPAVAFVQWLADEYAATGRRSRREDDEAA
jgi:hypothetical protein